MPNTTFAVTTKVAHDKLKVDADPTNLVPLANAAKLALQKGFPAHKVTAVKAEIIAGGKAVRFTVTSASGDANDWKVIIK